MKKVHADTPAAQAAASWWRTARRHSAKYIELTCKLHALNAAWPDIDRFATVLVKKHGDAPVEILGGRNALSLVSDYIEDAFALTDQLTRLQSRMRRHLAKAPPQVAALMRVTP